MKPYLSVVSRFYFQMASTSPFTVTIALTMLVAGICGLVTTLLIDPLPQVLNFIPTRAELVDQAIQPLQCSILFFSAAFFIANFNKLWLPPKRTRRTPIPRYLSKLLNLIVVISALYLFFNRADWFISRPFYLSVEEHLGQISVFEILAKSLLGVSGLLCGLSWGCAHSRLERSLSLLALAFTSLLLFAGGGKSIAFQLPLFFIGATAVSKKLAKWNRILITVSIVWFALFYQVAMANRQSDRHGISPYILNIQNPQFYDRVFDYSTLTGFLMFGANVRAASYDYLQQGTVPLSVALNPMPGGASGWNLVSEELRIAYFIPTPGLAELGALPNYQIIIYFVWLLALCFLVDFMLSKMRHGPRWFVGPIKAVLYMICIGWIQLFCIYNLRSSCRMIYYAVIVSGIGLAVYLLAEYVFGLKAFSSRPRRRVKMQILSNHE